MKNKLKRILAGLGACLLLLISAVVPAAAASDNVTLGRLEGATVSYVVDGIYKEADGSTVLNPFTTNTSFSAASSVFMDTVYNLNHVSAGLYEFAERCASWADSSLYFNKASFTVEFADPMKFADTFLYVMNYSGNVGFLQNFHLVTSTGIEVEASLVDGVVVPSDRTYANSLLATMTFSSFTFDIVVEGIAYAGQKPLNYIAFSLGYPVTSFSTPLDLPVGFYVDDGYICNVNSQAIQDAISKDSYEFGYSVGEKAGYDTGYNYGFSQGQNTMSEETYQKGYDKGNSDGYAQGYNVGKNAGDKAQYDKGYDSGYTDGFLEGGSTDLDMEMGNLFLSVVDAPVQVIVNTLDFDFLGFNLAQLFKALFTLAICLALFVVIIKAVV